MPRRTTGRRFARTALQAQGPSADGAGGTTRVLDFDLAALEGIEIIAITGMIRHTNTSFAVADNASNNDDAIQELHLEPGTLVDQGLLSEGDIGVQDVDAEVIFTQIETMIVIAGSSTEGQGAAHTIQPNGRQDLVDPVTRQGVFTSRNITHRAEVESNNSDAECLLIIEYYRVQFTIEEVGILNLRTG